MCFVSYGVRIGLRAREAAHLRQYESHLPPQRRPVRSNLVDRMYSVLVPKPAQGPVRRFHLLYADGALVARTPDPASLGEALENDLRLFVAVEARRRIFVHAGAVGWRDRAIVIPGESHSGKSTLVSALIRAGARYLSDEYAVFDDQGRVHPFAAPITLRSPDPGQPAVRCTPEALGGRTARRPLPLGLVLVTRYRAKAPFRPEELTPGQSVLALLEHALVGQTRPRDSMRALNRAARTARGYRTDRYDADAVAERVLRLLED